MKIYTSSDDDDHKKNHEYSRGITNQSFRTIEESGLTLSNDKHHDITIQEKVVGDKEEEKSFADMNSFRSPEISYQEDA